MKPSLEEIPEFYRPYIQALPEGELVPLLSDLGVKWIETLTPLSEEQADFAYAADKWTIKEVVQHVIDAERVFAYRALRFARGDKTDLPGFDQNAFVKNSYAGSRTLVDLNQEFEHVRQATIDLLVSLSTEEMGRMGTSNGMSFSAHTVGYIAAGHQAHHLHILRGRYLNS